MIVFKTIFLASETYFDLTANKIYKSIGISAKIKLKRFPTFLRSKSLPVAIPSINLFQKYQCSYFVGWSNLYHVRLRSFIRILLFLIWRKRIRIINSTSWNKIELKEIHGCSLPAKKPKPKTNIRKSLPFSNILSLPLRKKFQEDGLHRSINYFVNVDICISSVSDNGEQLVANISPHLF